MKGALLKEFYVWQRTGIVYGMMYVIIGFAYGVVGALSGVLLGLMLGSVNRLFLEDEKNCWSEFSRTLPYSAAHRVSARYIIIIFEMMIAMTAVIVSGTSATFNDNGIFDFSKYFPYFNSRHLAVSAAVMAISVVVVGIAFTIPLSYLFKGNKRTVISMIPMLLSIVAILLIYMGPVFSLLPRGSNGLSEVLFYEKWLMPVMIAASLAVFAISWIVSIIINTNSGREKLGKIKAAAIILSVAIVAAGAVSVGVLYQNGWFDKTDVDYEAFYDENFDDYISSEYGTADREEKQEPTKSELECREKLTELMGSFFDESHIDLPLEYCREELEELGYKEDEYGSGNFYFGPADGDHVEVDLDCYEDSDLISGIDINASTGGFYIDEATTEELEEIGNRFYEGMTVEEMIAEFDALEIMPNHMRELKHPDFGKVQYYFINGTIMSYNGGEQSPFSINIDVSDGKIIDVRTYDYTV